MNYKVRAIFGLCLALLGFGAGVFNCGAIHITINGLGKVSPNLDGVELPEGKIYNLRATPGAGHAFDGWRFEDGTSPGTVTLRIRQRDGTLYQVFNDGYEEALPGDTIEVDFVPSPFLTRKGSYIGANDVGGASFSFNLTDNGAYSGSLRLGSKRYSFSGLLFADGTGSSTIRTGANDFFGSQYPYL